jgi:hypothetical protein
MFYKNKQLNFAPLRASCLKSGDPPTALASRERDAKKIMIHT